MRSQGEGGRTYNNLVAKSAVWSKYGLQHLVYLGMLGLGLDSGRKAKYVGLVQVQPIVKMDCKQELPRLSAECSQYSPCGDSRPSKERRIAELSGQEQTNPQRAHDVPALSYQASFTNMKVIILQHATVKFGGRA